MRKIFLTILVAWLAVQDVHAAVLTLPFTDHFTNSEGNLYTVATGIWDAGGNAGAEITVSNSAALTSPSGFTNASGKGVRWSPSGTARRSIVQFSAATNGALYASFLINIVSPPSSGSRLVAYFDSSTSQPSSPQLGFFVGTSTLGIGKKVSTLGATVSAGSGTHLVVVRYTFTGTSSDQVDLWVDPASANYGAAIAPAASATTSGGNNVASIPYFGIYAASGTGPSLYLDEVRIGTNWADVTPLSGTAPPATNSTPRFTHAECAAPGTVLRGTNGDANGVFVLLASTNLSLPLAQWTPMMTNNFDSNGAFNFTNPISGGVIRQFFILRVGGTNTPVAPAITSQPQNNSAAVGQSVLFNVTVTGSAPLVYQWYFNTNTPLSGGTNSSLTLSTVSSNNAGGYSVIVTNSAGSVTSIVATLTISPAPTNGDFYVSPTGNDSNPGTLAAPFYSLQKTVTLAAPGNTIYVRGGTFPYVDTIYITNSGAPGALISLLAYPGEHPLLDYSNQPYADASRGILITTNGNYWHIKGLEIARCGDNAIKLEGSHNLIEQCVFHDNGDTGLQIGFAHETVNDGSLGGYNQIVNCDSYHNYDDKTKGGNADGFACKLHPGAGNVFIGCRSWFNSDDGWDFFESDSTIVLSNCWTWHNGDKSLFPVSSSFGGNGNGFKMGGNGTGGSSRGTHYAYNCIAFNMNFQNTSKNGFTDNSHGDGEILHNCAAFGCNYNFFFEQSVNSGKSNAFVNCVNFSPSGSSGNPVPGVSFGSGTVIQDHNTWTLPLTANAADFTDTTEAAAAATRQPDGSLPTAFMRLVSGSDLIDKGVDVGIPFNGSAPDLGAFEFGP